MERKTRDMDMKQEARVTGVYLYCFARPRPNRDGTNVVCHGLDGHEPVAFVDVDDVSGVYSRVAIEDFTGESGERHLEDARWVVPRACRHEQVIEEMMKISPVFPVRFGAVFSSGEALAMVVAENRREISSFLYDVAGKEEWSVKGYMDIEGAADRLLKCDASLRRVQKGAMARRDCAAGTGPFPDPEPPLTPGTRYLTEKRFRAEALKEVRRMCRSAAVEVQKELAELAADSCPQRLQPHGTSDSKREMVLHRAFLLPRESVAEFRERVMETGLHCLEVGISLELSGPWPPYSFCPSLGKPRT